MKRELDDLLEILLTRRGISSDERERFLHPSYERDLHDPFLFSHMERATERILSGIARGEQIAIFGDYDADGVPGTAVLASWFRKVGAPARIYIPNRHTEDYGLSERALRELAGGSVTLLITVDCGISNAAEVALAKELGMDVIITDHHLPPEILPDAYAILNPKCDGENYPFKELSGAGVAFKFVQALVRCPDAPAVGGVNWEKWLLDLVAIATISDMVPLSGENRALAYFGLSVLRQTRRPGLRALLNELRVNPAELTEDDIGYLIGPRINSASRMSHAMHAFTLLMTEDMREAQALARELEAQNRERKELVEVIMEHAHGLLDASTLPSLIVVGHGGWSLGVLGLAASRLVETYHRPVFVWGINEDGFMKGSCRSDGTVNVVELMRSVGEGGLFANYGGHREAGGFMVAEGREHELAERLIAAYELLKKPASLNGGIKTDCTLSLSDVTQDTYNIIIRLAPFGMGNEKPLFLFEGVEVAGVRNFGVKNAHVELLVRSATCPARGVVPAIGFFARRTVPHAHTLKECDWVDVVAHLDRSTYRSRPTLRLRLVDVSRVA